jgi:hypothetical protein
MYFERLNLWRLKHGIPEQVYIRISPLPPAKPANNRTADGPVGRPENLRFGGAIKNDTFVPRSPDDEQEPFNPKAQKNRRYSRDFEKPQFIDFESPLLVELFAHLPGELPSFLLHIEERYPSKGALPELRGEKRACEMVFQLDWNDNGSPSLH